MATVDLGSYKAEIVLDDSKFTTKMNEAERDIRRFEGGIGTWGSKLGTLAKGALVGLGASITAIGVKAGKTGLEFNAMMEQSEIAWTTLLGSADQAKKTINDLVELGARTPFEFEGLDKSAKLLNMAGFEGEKLKETLIAVGDAVSAVGGGQDVLEGVSMALFQMSAKGKASAEEMNQLAERGIPAWQILSETMGKPIPELMKMSEQGKLMADQVIPALVEGMGDRFGGAMEKQSQTFDGLMSTLKDNLKSFSAMITSDLFEKIKSFLPSIIDFINQISDAFKNAGWKGVIQEILPPQVFSFIQQSLGILKQIISDFVKFGKDIWKKHGDEIIATAKITWEVIGQTIKGLLEVIRGVIKTVLSLISGDWKGAWEGIKSIAKGVWDIIGSIISNAIRSIQNTMSSSLESIKTISSNIWNGIKTSISSTWDAIKSLISNAVKNISNVFSSIHSTTQSVWNNIKTAITSPIESAKNTVLGIISSIKDAFSKLTISIPKPKLPHIDVNWKSFGVGDLSVKVPTFDVSWYQTGGIFDKPSIVGLAENGREAILPLENPTYMNPFADAVWDRMKQNMKNESVTNNHQNMHIQNTFNFSIAGAIDERTAQRAAKIVSENIVTSLKLGGMMYKGGKPRFI
ncbi:tape measure protein [Anoxybacillus flavithermus]|uniref:tape measure protein n=1 Tax=Anoxybacillus flavithermus TaxID=33934 RepID=UPI0018676707|nr:tape measure protein [Anoxybacillus flavithermus]MBE2914737.1 tape measure protein [Anoxybacillus flavithermus]